MRRSEAGLEPGFLFWAMVTLDVGYYRKLRTILCPDTGLFWFHPRLQMDVDCSFVRIPEDRSHSVWSHLVGLIQRIEYGPIIGVSVAEYLIPVRGVHVLVSVDQALCV